MGEDEIVRVSNNEAEDGVWTARLDSSDNCKLNCLSARGVEERLIKCRLLIFNQAPALNDFHVKVELVIS